MQRRWFFFYGTLTHEFDNALTRAVLPLLADGRRACVRGQMHAVRTASGWYPVLCAGQGHVFGRVYRVKRGFGAKHLRMLDAYEDFCRRRPARSEYRREAIHVRIAGAGGIKAEAYRYNRPIHAGLRVISNGDFAAYAKGHRLRVFGT